MSTVVLRRLAAATAAIAGVLLGTRRSPHARVCRRHRRGQPQLASSSTSPPAPAAHDSPVSFRNSDQPGDPTSRPYSRSSLRRDAGRRVRISGRVGVDLPQESAGARSGSPIHDHGTFELRRLAATGYLMQFTSAAPSGKATITARGVSRAAPGSAAPARHDCARLDQVDRHTPKPQPTNTNPRHRADLEAGPTRSPPLPRQQGRPTTGFRGVPVEPVRHGWPAGRGRWRDPVPALPPQPRGSRGRPPVGNPHGPGTPPRDPYDDVPPPIAGLPGRPVQPHVPNCRAARDCPPWPARRRRPAARPALLRPPTPPHPDAAARSAAIRRRRRTEGAAGPHPRYGPTAFRGRSGRRTSA